MSRETNPNATIRHFVGVKFKKDATPEQIQQYVDTLSLNPYVNPLLYNYWQGFCVDPIYHNLDCDFALCGDIPGYAAMDAYMSHKGHLGFNVDCVESVFAFNWEVTQTGREDRPSEEFVQAEIERERKRTAPVHPDPNMAYVPDFRGQTLERAHEMIAAAGLEADPEVIEIIGASWAPGRVVDYEPMQYTEVPKGTVLKLRVTGDYRMKSDVEYVRPKDGPRASKC